MNPVRWEDYEAAVDERDELRCRVAELEQSLSTCQHRIRELEDENASLEYETGSLQAEIDRLGNDLANIGNGRW